MAGAILIPELLAGFSQKTPALIMFLRFEKLLLGALLTIKEPGHN